MRNLEIKPKLNGWIVTVGCQDILFTDKDKMLEEISRYIDNPKEVQEEYLENAKNETHHTGFSFSSGVIASDGNSACDNARYLNQ